MRLTKLTSILSSSDGISSKVCFEDSTIFRHSSTWFALILGNELTEHVETEVKENEK